MSFALFPVGEISADQCVETYWESVENYYFQLKKENVVRLTVRRKMVWHYFRRARQRFYEPDKVLKITFSGEPAVDTGGPKREFFAGRFFHKFYRATANGTF